MLEIFSIAKDKLDKIPDYQVVEVSNILRYLSNNLNQNFSFFKNSSSNELTEEENLIFKIKNQVLKTQSSIKEKKLNLYKDNLFSLKELLEVYSIYSPLVLRASNLRNNLYYSFLKNADKSNQPAHPPVERKDMNVDALTMAKALRQGYKKVFGTDPSFSILGFGWAQNASEHGFNPFVLPNYNIGNVKADDNWLKSGKPYFIKTTQEYKELPSGEYEQFIAKNVKWKAYDSLEESAAQYWSLLKRRYPDVLAAAGQGAAKDAAVSLGQKNENRKYVYYTQNPAQYSGAVSSLYKTFEQKFSDEFSDLKPKSDSSDFEVSSSSSTSSVSPSSTSSSAPSTESDEISPEDEELINELGRELLASKKPLTYFVKQALYKQNNPKKEVLILVEGSDNLDNLEYANNLSYLIRDYLQGTTTLHKDEYNKINIQASVHTELNLRNAVIELSNLLSNELKKKINKNVYTVVADNLDSFSSEIEDEEISSNHNKFLMRYS